MRALTFLARRFVAGDTATEAISAVRKLNEKSLKATLDFLGEDCRTKAQAESSTREIEGLFHHIENSKLDSNVSLKLTQLGLNLDPLLARKNLLRILETADSYRNFVRLDMEGSLYTQTTLDLFYDVFRERRNVGVVIQAYLLRSREDIEALIKIGARVRLCKGAYKEPPSIAFQAQEEVNDNYDFLARRLLESGNYPALATHDEGRIQAALAFVRQKNIPKDHFEFQMLYGLRAKRWSELRSDGHPVRIYVPYGTHWFPYFYRRLRERKENLMFVAKNFFE